MKLTQSMDTPPLEVADGREPMRVKEPTTGYEYAIKQCGWRISNMIGNTRYGTKCSYEQAFNGIGDFLSGAAAGIAEFCGKNYEDVKRDIEMEVRKKR